VVAVVGDGAQALRLAAAVAADAVVLDLQLPDRAGVEVIQGLPAATPDTRMLVPTASGEQRDVPDAVKAGATGYLVRSAQCEEFLSTVRRTAEGDAVFTAGLAGLALGEFRRLAAAGVDADPGAQPDRAGDRRTAPDRQGTVL
jgi:DNA-binding NarL/FixJ family response regulator